MMQKKETKAGTAGKKILAEGRELGDVGEFSPRHQPDLNANFWGFSDHLITQTGQNGPAQAGPMQISQENPVFLVEDAPEPVSTWQMPISKIIYHNFLWMFCFFCER